MSRSAFIIANHPNLTVSPIVEGDLDVLVASSALWERTERSLELHNGLVDAWAFARTSREISEGIIPEEGDIHGTTPLETGCYNLVSGFFFWNRGFSIPLFGKVIGEVLVAPDRGDDRDLALPRGKALTWRGYTDWYPHGEVHRAGVLVACGGGYTGSVVVSSEVLSLGVAREEVNDYLYSVIRRAYHY